MMVSPLSLATALIWSSSAALLRLIVPYATEEQFRSVYEDLLANLDPYLKVLESREGAFVFEDYWNKFGIVERKGKTLEVRVHLDVRPKI
jgi:hypothetical protein